MAQIKSAVRRQADPGKAKILAGFFKTGKGQYGEGDVFLGVMMPQQRRIARAYPDLTLRQIASLLAERIHEFRMIGLLILVDQYKKADHALRGQIAEFYLSHAHHINSWDLVDISAPHIIGAYALATDAAILQRLSVSDSLWKRRMSIVATLAFIRAGRFQETCALAKSLLRDQHPLIHKAAGWMLREVGKRDIAALDKFLALHAPEMPRTMLRYAIERYAPKKRRFWLTRYQDLHQL